MWWWGGVAGQAGEVWLLAKLSTSLWLTPEAVAATSSKAGAGEGRHSPPLPPRHKTRQGRQAAGCHKYLCEFWEQQCRQGVAWCRCCCCCCTCDCLRQYPLSPPTHTPPATPHVALMQLTMSSRIHLHLPHPRHVCSASWASAASPTSLLSSFGCHAHTHIHIPSQAPANGWRAKVDTTHPPAKAKQLLCRVQLLLQLQLQLQLHFDANQAGNQAGAAPWGQTETTPASPSQVTPCRQNKRAKFSSQGVKRFVN